MLSKEVHIFLRKRILFESELDAVLYKKTIPAGELCSHAINRWFRGQEVISITGFLRSLFWVFLQSFKPSAIKGVKHLYLKPNDEGRTQRLYSVLETEIKGRDNLSLTINHFYTGYSLTTVFFKWILEIIPGILSLQRVLQKAKHETLELKRRRILSLYLTFIIQTIKVEIALTVFRKNNISSVLVDLDRSSFGAPIILAAKANGVRNFTLVHGAVFPPYLYVPVIADHVLCWGELHKELFQKYTLKEVNYVLAGCPISMIKKPVRVKRDEKRTLTFVSQNFSENYQYDAIEKIASMQNELASEKFQLVVRPHPADDQERMMGLCEKYQIPFSNEAIEDCIFNTDVFIVMSSAFAFDAIGAGVSVIFFSVNETQDGMAELFKERANALVARDEKELFRVLTDKGYQDQNYNLSALSDLFNSYNIRSGVDAAKVIVKEMEGL